VFGLSCQDVEGDDVICAGGVNVDQPIADVGISKDIAGDEKTEQVIREERVRVNQAAAPSSSNVLVEAILQELGFAFA